MCDIYFFLNCNINKELNALFFCVKGTSTSNQNDLNAPAIINTTSQLINTNFPGPEHNVNRQVLDHNFKVSQNKIQQGSQCFNSADSQIQQWLVVLTLLSVSVNGKHRELCPLLFSMPIPFTLRANGRMLHSPLSGLAGNVTHKSREVIDRLKMRPLPYGSCLRGPFEFPTSKSELLRAVDSHQRLLQPHTHIQA